MKYTTEAELLKLTSKEALAKLRLAIYRPTEETAVINTENVLLDVIEKDLEVLKALKRNVGIRIAIQEWANKESKIFPNDRKIVKEWLENGK